MMSHSNTTNTQPQTQQSGGDEPIFDEIELLIGSALILVRREATKQWLMEVIQPGDEHWHMHDMTSSVMGIKQLIQAREREAEKRGAIQGAEFANNCLYDNCPTGDVSAWDMLKGVQKTQNQLSEFVQQLQSKPQAGEGGEG